MAALGQRGVTAQDDSAVLVQNVAYAIAKRLAFSQLSTPPPSIETGNVGMTPALDFHQHESDAVLAPFPRLVRAREALQACVRQRVRELQFLTSWPLVRPRRTPQQVTQMFAKAELAGSGKEAWSALGMPSSPFHELPDLPELVRKDLYTSLDLLLALAGHLGPTNTTSSSVQQSRSALSTGTANTSYPNGAQQPSLPRSLAQISVLPALQPLEPPSVEWLWEFLADLQPHKPQVGLDDRLDPYFREGKVQTARQLIAEGSITATRNFAKFGCPHGCRAGVWEAALGLSQGGDKKGMHKEFECLIAEACAQQLLADVWLCAEMATVHDSEHFFLFEEMLRAVTLAFLRDPRVGPHCSVQPNPVLSAPLNPDAAASPVCTAAAVATAATESEGQQNKGQQSNVGKADIMSDSDAYTTCPYPPCGVLAPQGSILLAAPLCFMYGNPAAVYRMHRALYCRFWCKLHTLSPVGLPSPALPMLLRTYEDLLQTLDPEVVAHLHRLGIPMAAVALPWVTRAFVGFMPVEEVLLLWDRVIGLDSLFPVALLAVAVVCFRRQVILSCQASREVLDAMSDLSQLQTVPLLQAVLFQG